MPAAAVQGLAEPFLQHAQLAGNRGLGQVQGLGGAADVAGIGYAGEGQELVGGHIVLIIIFFDITYKK
ncbi:hypothetical protein D9M68_824200 [compost metagenome]